MSFQKDYYKSGFQDGFIIRTLAIRSENGNWAVLKNIAGMCLTQLHRPYLEHGIDPQDYGHFLWSQFAALSGNIRIEINRMSQEDLTPKAKQSFDKMMDHVKYFAESIQQMKSAYIGQTGIEVKNQWKEDNEKLVKPIGEWANQVIQDMQSDKSYMKVSASPAKTPPKSPVGHVWNGAVVMAVVDNMNIPKWKRDIATLTQKQRDELTSRLKVARNESDIQAQQLLKSGSTTTGKVISMLKQASTNYSALLAAM